MTEREREILGLVAQGSSNKEIAATLVISERTARTHVSNILSKLDLSSRTQAALWAGARQAARNAAALGQTAARLAGRSQLWEVFGEIARHAVEGTRAVACAIAAADDAGVLRAGGSVGVGEGFRQVALSGAMRIRDLPTPTSCSAAAPRSFPMPGSDGSSRNGRRSAPRSRTSSGRRACMSR